MYVGQIRVIAMTKRKPRKYVQYAVAARATGYGLGFHGKSLILPKVFRHFEAAFYAGHRAGTAAAINAVIART